MVPPKYLESKTKHLPKNLFFGILVIAPFRRLFIIYMKKKLDGLIHVTAFGCGPDAMVDKLMELEAKKMWTNSFSHAFFG